MSTRKAGDNINPLEWLGNRLGEMDDSYSQAIRDTAPKEDPKEGDWLSETVHAIRTGAAHIPGVDRKGGFFDPADERYNETVDNIAKGTAIASRYVLPAAGVTLAGKGIYDLAVGFGGPADQPEQQTLPVNTSGSPISGGHVLAMSALGSGVAAGPSIYNEFRDEKFRTKADALGAVGMAAAGAGAGALTSVVGQSLLPGAIKQAIASGDKIQANEEFPMTGQEYVINSAGNNLWGLGVGAGSTALIMSLLADEQARKFGGPEPIDIPMASTYGIDDPWLDKDASVLQEVKRRG